MHGYPLHQLAPPLSLGSRLARGEIPERYEALFDGHVDIDQDETYFRFIKPFYKRFEMIAAEGALAPQLRSLRSGHMHLF